MNEDPLFVAVEDLPYAKELVTKLPYAESELRTTITQAIGAASTCWDNLMGAGVFESERAGEIAKELIGKVIHVTGFGEPSLGLATNAELENELKVRKEMGFTDPEYRTMD